MCSEARVVDETKGKTAAAPMIFSCWFPRIGMSTTLAVSPSSCRDVCAPFFIVAMIVLSLPQKSYLARGSHRRRACFFSFLSDGGSGQRI